MSTFDLKFTEDIGSGLATSPTAEIIVPTFSRTGDQLPIITPGCITTGELEAEITRLKAELDDVLLRAAFEFRQAGNAPE